MKLLFNGHPWPQNIKPQDLDWEKCWTDVGPSPAGNVGFYLHVPHVSDGTTHRIYFVQGKKEVE